MLKPLHHSTSSRTHGLLHLRQASMLTITPLKQNPGLLHLRQAFMLTLHHSSRTQIYCTWGRHPCLHYTTQAEPRSTALEAGIHAYHYTTQAEPRSTALEAGIHVYHYTTDDYNIVSLILTWLRFFPEHKRQSISVVLLGLKVKIIVQSLVSLNINWNFLNLENSRRFVIFIYKNNLNLIKTKKLIKFLLILLCLEIKSIIFRQPFFSF
jgi:hypothetical protein